MFQTLKRLFGMAASPNYRMMVKQGAVILDVRSADEFKRGHISNAINIPLDELSHNTTGLRNKSQCVICCCASGVRSGAAKKILVSKGFTEVYNGGNWSSLKNKL